MPVAQEVDYLQHLEERILQPWMIHAVDRDRGGFFGRLDPLWRPDRNADKGLVQHARFMWAFSAAFRRAARPEYRRMADHARDFLESRFRDSAHDGWFWSVEADGTPRDLRKHVYPHSFVVYAYSEYARAFGDTDALRTASETFGLVDERAHDTRRGGYHECFTRDWAPTDQHPDLGIDGPRKSMNSHIHMMEAVSTLFAAATDLTGATDILERERLGELVDLCRTRIFNAQRNSLDLFFEADWERLPSPTSFGHDIELSWLLDEAAHLLGRRAETRDVSLRLAENTLRGLGEGQGLYYEGDAAGQVLDRRRVWWVQAEGMVGFLNAWLLSGDARFIGAFREVEAWVVQAQFDRVHGDWHEEVWEERAAPCDKGHLWKEPYHQGRACLEVEKRLVRAS